MHHGVQVKPHHYHFGSTYDSKADLPRIVDPLPTHTERPPYSSSIRLSSNYRTPYAMGDSDDAVVHTLRSVDQLDRRQLQIGTTYTSPSSHEYTEQSVASAPALGIDTEDHPVQFTYLYTGRGETPMRRLCPDAGCFVGPPIDAERQKRRWSDPLLWVDHPLGRVPRSDDAVEIPQEWWVLLDVSTPVLRNLTIRGTLELLDESDLTITVDGPLLVLGGRLMAGSNESHPFTHSAVIELRGDRQTPELAFDKDATFGAKSIAVAGELSLFGVAPARPWARLARTMAEGDSELFLEGSVLEARWPATHSQDMPPLEAYDASVARNGGDPSEPLIHDAQLQRAAGLGWGRAWSVGDEVVVSPTDYDPHEAETRHITAIELRTFDDADDLSAAGMVALPWEPANGPF